MRLTPAFTPEVNGDAEIWPIFGHALSRTQPHLRQEANVRQGAAVHGGRFNPKGMPALYTSLSIMTALKEANQVGHLQPTTLVSYLASFDAIFDSRDGPALDARGMNSADLADSTWRDQMRAQGKAKTQTFAYSLSVDGYQGMLVNSFAAGAGPDDLNLVLWQWGEKLPARLVLIDDDNRLGAIS